MMIQRAFFADITVKGKKKSAKDVRGGEQQRTRIQE
jgi:hypothetical protein